MKKFSNILNIFAVIVILGILGFYIVDKKPDLLKVFSVNKNIKSQETQNLDNTESSQIEKNKQVEQVSGANTEAKKQTSECTTYDCVVNYYKDCDATFSANITDVEPFLTGLINSSLKSNETVKFYFTQKSMYVLKPIISNSKTLCSSTVILQPAKYFTKDEYRKILNNSGISNADIDKQLEEMNSSAVALSQKCTGSINDFLTYLDETKDPANVSINTTYSANTGEYKIGTQQKISCITDFQ